MPSVKDKILDLNQYMKSDNAIHFYGSIESLIRKIDLLANNTENSLTIKICECNPCGY